MIDKKELSAVGLVVIGDEILSGRRVDKHFSYCLGYFKELGVEINWMYLVGDDMPLLTQHFEIILGRGDVCFSFGGIGATPDDLTRQSVAAAHGKAIVRHPEAVKNIEDRFGEEAYPNRILMAELPAGAVLIPNEFNNIPGFSMGEIHCLPGFPEMAWPMMDWVVRSQYSLSAAPDIGFASMIVRNARESELIPLLKATQSRYPDVKISSLPRFPAEGVWQVELGVRGKHEQISAVLSQLRASLQKEGFSVSQLFQE